MKLTHRQQQVADLLATGLSNKQIAYELHISIKTVEVHITAIFKRLGVYNRVQVAVHLSRVIWEQEKLEPIQRP